MKRHIVVAIIAIVLVIVIYMVSWTLYPSWQKLGIGGILTLFVATIFGVVTFLQNLISIWKDLKDEPKSSQEKPLKIVSALQHLGRQADENIQIPQLDVNTSENKDKESTVVETLQSNVSVENIEKSPTLDYPWYWSQHDASAIFQGRLAAAFPGTRNVQTLQGIEAVDRLEILLSDPLYMKLPNGNGEFDPFWWFRGYASSEITRFLRLASDRFLLGAQEMKIDYIMPVRIFGDDERNFVYVQILAEEPTGVYQYSEGWLEEYLQEQLNDNFGYYYFEAYGIWKDKFITVEELQDGGTIVNGKPTRITDAEYRERFITKFNFIICGQNHVINNSEGDKNAEVLLNDMLLGKKDISDFIRYVKMLPRHPYGSFHYG